MVERIESDSSDPQPLLVVGSVAFDNVITPSGSRKESLVELHPIARWPPVTTHKFVWWV